MASAIEALKQSTERAPGPGTDEPKPYRWTIEEYLRLGECGFFRDVRIELIEGEIFRMSPQNPPHAIVVARLTHWIVPHCGDRCYLRPQLPLAVGDDSLPEPDISLVAGPPDDVQSHPETAVLVIEVSDSSVAFDRSRKLALYARAGVPDYWIVNLPMRQVEVYREPTSDPDAHRGYRYASVTTVAEGGAVVPLALPELKIAIAELLPPPKTPGDEPEGPPAG